MAIGEPNWDSALLNKVLDFYRSLISLAILLSLAIIVVAIGTAIVSFALSFRSETYSVKYPEYKIPEPSQIASVDATELKYNPTHLLSQAVGGQTWQYYGSRIDSVCTKLGLSDYDKRLLWAYLEQDVGPYIEGETGDSDFLDCLETWAEYRLRNPGKPLALHEVLAKIEAAFIQNVVELDKSRIEWEQNRLKYVDRIRKANSDNRQIAVEAILIAWYGFILIAMLVLSVLLFKIEMNTR